MIDYDTQAKDYLMDQTAIRNGACPDCIAKPCRCAEIVEEGNRMASRMAYARRPQVGSGMMLTTKGRIAEGLALRPPLNGDGDH